MAISWITVLSAVPWTEVIRNAPKVAEGAKSLWGAVRRKDGMRVTTTHETDPTERLSALEATVDELSRQMQASAELIKALAEQNTQLVQRCELNRRRIIGLSLIVLILLVAGGVWCLTR